MKEREKALAGSVAVGNPCRVVRPACEAGDGEQAK